jgi:hypothetical protein
MVERTFPDGLNNPINQDGMTTVDGVVATNASSSVPVDAIAEVRVLDPSFFS